MGVSRKIGGQGVHDEQQGIADRLLVDVLVCCVVVLSLEVVCATPTLMHRPPPPLMEVADEAAVREAMRAPVTQREGIEPN